MSGRPPSQARRRIATLRGPFLVWLAWMGSWLLVVGALTLPELVLGGIVAAVATAAIVAVARDAGVRPASARGWAVGVASLPLDVVVEWAALLGVLARRLVRGQRARGRFRTVPLAGAGVGAQEGARRASITLLSSFAPNTYVVGFEHAGTAVRIHQLAPREPKIRGAG